MSSKRMGILAGLLLLLLLSAPLTHGAESTQIPADTRISLHLTQAERAEFLASMRLMLGSVQGILKGIGSDDRSLIEKSAKQSGNQMVRDTPASIRKKLPPGFAELGAPTHLAFEEIAIRAETDPRESLTRLMAHTMNQCMACHARYKAD